MASVFDTLSGPQLLSLYNHRCKLLGMPERASKFRTKADGVAKLEALPGWTSETKLMAPEAELVPVATREYTSDHDDPEMHTVAVVEHETAEAYRERTNSYSEFEAFSAELNEMLTEPVAPKVHYCDRCSDEPSNGNLYDAINDIDGSPVHATKLCDFCAVHTGATLIATPAPERKPLRLRTHLHSGIGALLQSQISQSKESYTAFAALIFGDL